MGGQMVGSEMYVGCVGGPGDADLPSGYRRATFGEQATHAVCRHGRLEAIDGDSHACRWTPLVKLADEKRDSAWGARLVRPSEQSPPDLSEEFKAELVKRNLELDQVKGPNDY